MKITDLKDQVKDETRVNVYINEKYVFSISKLDVAFYNLKVGEDITKKIYDEIFENVVLAKAKMTAMSFLSYKDRSKREVIRKLKEKGYTKEVTKQTLKFLISYGYINDLEFAKKFVKQRVGVKGYGKFKVVRELRDKGISDEIIEKVTENIVETEEEMALTLAMKKARSLDLTEYKDKQKLFAYLQRRGYSFEIIKRVLEKVSKSYLDDEDIDDTDDTDNEYVDDGE